MDSIGGKVKYFRKERGLSQDELAEGICSRQTISLLENEMHVPSAWMLQKIAERLGIPLPEILAPHEKTFEDKLYVEIVKVYVASANYDRALALILEREKEEEAMLEHMRREVVICKAECLIRVGESKQAMDDLIHLQRQLEQTRDPDEYTLANVYHKIGMAYYYLADMFNAYTYFRQAYQIAERFPLEDVLFATIHYSLGNVCRQIQLDDQAVMYLSKAMELFEKFSNPVNFAHSVFALGIAYKNLKQFDRAESYILQAKAIYEAQQIYSLAQVSKEGYLFGVLAVTEPEKALEELKNSLTEYEQIDDVSQLPYVYARIASLSIDLELIEDAGEYMEKCLDLLNLEKGNTSVLYPFTSDPRIAFVYQVEGKYLLFKGDYEKSILSSFKSSEMFDGMGLLNDSAESLQLVVEAYERQGMAEQALKTAKQIVELLQPKRDVSFTT